LQLFRRQFSDSEILRKTSCTGGFDGTETSAAQERLYAQARADTDKAVTLPEGAERDALLQRAAKMKRASDITGWLNSADLKPPE